MRIGSLCSGAGGLDMAAERVFGGRTVWHAEIDKAASNVLAHRWPGVPNLGDLTAIDWASYAYRKRGDGPAVAVDILTGGYPCQPFSAAGQRKGTDDERHIWPHVREAIRHLRPRYTFLENVAGHRSLGFDRVLGDLAEDGLHVRWTSIRAADVGACHSRERLFILATSADSDGPTVREHTGEPSTEEVRTVTGDGSGDRGGVRTTRIGRRDRLALFPTPRASDGAHGGPNQRGSKGDLMLSSAVAQLLPTPTSRDHKGRNQRDDDTCLAGALLPTPSSHDATGARTPEQLSGMDKPFSNLNDTVVNELLSTPQARDSKGIPKDGFNVACLPRDIAECELSFGKYTAAVRRWEAITRPAPVPTEPGVCAAS